MGTYILRVAILMIIGALPLAAQAPSQESLGTLARQVREQHQKENKKTAKVFTNDDLPSAKPGETINFGPPAPPPPASVSSKPATPPSPAETTEKPPESPEDKAKTRDYWQARFRAARKNLAAAKTAQQLGEDELNLLQIQQAREIDPNLKADLNNKVQAKQSEVDVNRAATEAAQKAVDNLEKAFEESGAPDDWSQTD